ncbi:protein kinase [Diaporthe helianthi]|uniref:Protein kinase n=1 Tax=Diaporthe helianthi TaxID=158607 RepID=A0A2P5ID79_DIAHE|nr:protein kinase [Diaporthe helianthi]
MFYLIFPWAEADLQSYLGRKNPRPTIDHPTVQWLAEQCLGIADGLCQLHRHQTTYISSAWSDNDTNISGLYGNGRTDKVQLYGRHGDIKLQNILWFCDPKKVGDRGVLKIADFGLAEFKTSPARLYQGMGRIKFSPPYQPPECNVLGGRVGQSHDIWSLGCLYLELITWLLGGWELVKSFQVAREATYPEYHANVINGTFFTIVPGGVDGSGVAVVKPAVTEFIESLHSNASCTEYLHKFLYLIERDMLIIKPTKQTEKGGIGMPELTFQLRALCRQICDDPAFATTAAA